MCVLAMAWRADPRWELVVAANRDELHARPSTPLGEWSDRPGLTGGRDEASGGTWLGIAPGGRFCAVTNVSSGARRPDGPSRGHLVTGLLTSDEPERGPRDRLSAYSGVNVTLVSGGRAWFGTNTPDTSWREIEPGVHGLSNGRLEAPWPKVDVLEGRVGEALAADDPIEPLLGALADRTRFAPSRAEPYSAAPLFIADEVYGTRCSTVVAVSANGAGTIVERRFDASGTPTGETRLAFEWPIVSNGY